MQRIISPIAFRYNLKAVFLFGSYARGEATEESDIDFLVDTTGASFKSLFGLGALYCDLEDALGKKIDVLTVSSLEQEARMPSEVDFHAAVLKERISLYVRE